MGAVIVVDGLGQSDSGIRTRFRTSGGLTGALQPAGILFPVTRHLTKSFDFSGHLGNVG